jgi:hypothetical protein
MTIYHGIIPDAGENDDIIHSDTLNEFFSEFIEFRK